MTLDELRILTLQDSAEVATRPDGWVLIRNYTPVRDKDGDVRTYVSVDVAEAYARLLHTPEHPVVAKRGDRYQQMVVEQLDWLDAMEARWLAR